MSAGKLIVEIVATTAAFQSDLGKASAAAETHARKIDTALAGVKNSIARNLVGAAASVGAAFSAAGFVNLIRGTIEAQDHLAQLSKSTGVSVEQLGGLGFAASTTGGNLDDMASSFRRFSVNAAAAAAGSEKEAEVFKLLGISIKDIQTLKPDQLFIKAADAFASFEDGPNVAALASAAFGKAYQGILPTLKQGGELLRQNIAYYDRFGGVTTETAERSAQFSTELKKAGLLTGAFGRNLTADLLPGLKVLVDFFVEAKESGDQFAGVTKKIGDFMVETAVETTYLIEGFEQLQRAVRSAHDRLAALAHLDFSGGFGLAAKGESEEIEALSKKYDDLRTRIRTAQAEAGKPFVGPPDLRPRRQAGALTASDASATAKKELETRLAELDAFIKLEEDALRRRQDFLSDYYKNDKIGIEQFFAARTAEFQTSITKERAALEEERALIKAHQAKAAPTEQEEDKKKLVQITLRLAELDQKATDEVVKGFRERGKAVEDFIDKVQELEIAEAESRGDPGAVAKRFDFEHRLELRNLQANRDSANELIRLQSRIGEVAVGQLRERALAQDRLNHLEGNFSALLGGISTVQSRIDLAVSTGNLTEIEGLNARSALAQRYVGLLNQMLDLAEKEANNPAFSDEARAKAVLNVEALRLQIAQLESQTDALAKKFRDVFESSFADALTNLVTGAKSLRDTIKDLLKDVERQLASIASKNVAEQLFGKGGPLGGVSDFFAGAFGGKGAGSGLGADAALTTAGVSLDASAAALSASAVAITTAAATLAASGAAGAGLNAFGGLAGSDSFGLGSLGLFQGAFADGTDFVPRTGLALIHKGEKITPARFNTPAAANDARTGGGGHTFHINISVPGNTSTATAAQIARETGIAVRRELHAAGMGR